MRHCDEGRKCTKISIFNIRAFLWRNRTTQAKAASFLKFSKLHTHTHTHTHAHTRTHTHAHTHARTHTHTHTVGLLRPTDQLVAESAAYTTHIKHKRRTSMSSEGFVPANPAIECLQSYALDHTTTGIKSATHHELLNKEAEQIRKLWNSWLI